jgi:hypothetical protein
MNNQLAMQDTRPPAVPGSFDNPVPNSPAELARVPIGEPLKTLEEVVLFGRALAFAGLLPDSLMDRRTQTVKVADVVLLLCMGAELQLSPMQSIHGIYVVKGRPMLSAQLWATRIRQYGHKLSVTMENFPSGRVKSATATITRKDDPTPQSLEFSVWDARNAGLVQAVADDGTVRAQVNGNATPWQQYTATMLRNRAISHCARFACPEVVFGSMGIKGEEYDELEEETGFGDDRFEAGRAIEGSPAQNDALADELTALAARMAGATGMRPIGEALGAISEAAAEHAGVSVARPRRKAAGDASDAPVEIVTEPGHAVRDHTNTRLCDVCGFRWFPGEHEEADNDHDAVWVDEPED